MTKYVFLNLPVYGQVNPTLAIVQELVARGDEVVYIHAEQFRAPIEASGARFVAQQAPPAQPGHEWGSSAEADNRRLALLPIRLLLGSRRAVPPLLELVRAEQPDCIVYSGLLLWGRIIAHALGIPSVALYPSYVPYGPDRQAADRPSQLPAETQAALRRELAHLRATYALPFDSVRALIAGDERLALVFLPRAFHPDGAGFDARFLFVGPSFRPQRDRGVAFPLERLDQRPCLYIALGTMFNRQADFYNSCFEAFGGSTWQVVLALGQQVTPDELHAIPSNFITAPYVPQLDLLPRADVFLSHGGMNSTMESLYFGVPLIVVPHQREQQRTAERIQELGLGVALAQAQAGAAALREALAHVAGDPGIAARVHEMQQHVRSAGGYLRAADALQAFVRG